MKIRFIFRHDIVTTRFVKLFLTYFEINHKKHAEVNEHRDGVNTRVLLRVTRLELFSEHMHDPLFTIIIYLLTVIFLEMFLIYSLVNFPDGVYFFGDHVVVFRDFHNQLSFFDGGVLAQVLDNKYFCKVALRNFFDYFVSVLDDASWQAVKAVKFAV